VPQITNKGLSEILTMFHYHSSRTACQLWSIKWTEDEYFALHGNRLIELVNGTLLVLPMPTWLHQLIVKFLTRQIETATDGL